MTAPPRLSASAAALRHVPGADDLPRVVASGRGAVAERIVELAFAHGIPVREDADLAAVLARIDQDAAIPPDSIMAVAEVLSHLYRLNRTLAAERAPHPSPLPGEAATPNPPPGGATPDPLPGGEEGAHRASDGKVRG